MRAGVAHLRNLRVRKSCAGGARLRNLRVEEINAGGAHLRSLRFGCDVRSGHLRDVSLKPGALGCLGLFNFRLLLQDLTSELEITLLCS